MDITSDFKTNALNGIHEMMAYDAKNKVIPRIAAEIAIDSTADKVCERLYDVILEFQSQLDDLTDVGLQLVSFGASQIINVTSIGNIGPNLIAFEGLLKGEKVYLTQHVSQLNFLLCTVPKQKEHPRRKIGFHVWDED